MKADEPTPLASTPDPITGISPTTPGSEAETPTQTATPPGSVSEGINELWQGFRNTVPWNPRIAGIVLGAVLVGGVWWYLSKESRTAASHLWTEFTVSDTLGGLGKFATDNPNTVQGRVARLEQARQQFGPQGVALLPARDPARRTTGIDNIEKARSEFLKLAEEFPDVALKAEALRGAAESELALVGIPKAGSSSDDFRGSVKAAVDLYRKLGKLLGETTPLGEAAVRRANDLENRSTDVRMLGVELNQLVAGSGDPFHNPVRPPPDLSTPPPTPAPPKAPIDPIPIPVPPPTSK